MSHHIKPIPRQAEFQDWELGFFMHFGLLTFCPGVSYKDFEVLTPEKFNPTQLDCRQWAMTAKEAGFRYAMMTVKHHSGFCTWPTKYTDFCVSSSPWRGGKGDVAREYVDAFREQGLKVGLYYSPYDSHNPDYENDAKAYDDYFVNQLTELLTQYGQIDILWFDGAGSERHTYDWPRIIGEIRRMQPEIVIFQMGTPDFRWVGNEAGIAPSPCPNVVRPDGPPVAMQEQLDVTEPVWMPAECDSMMSECWFYSDGDEENVKSLDLLLGQYYYSVGRGCNMLLNIGPDRRGLLPDKCAARLVEFGREVQRRFANPLATLADFEAVQDNKWKFTPPHYPFVLDHVVIQEDILHGERVHKFSVRVDTNPRHHSEPVLVHDGYSIGHKAICKFPPIRASHVFVEILDADGPVHLSSIELFDTTA